MMDNFQPRLNILQVNTRDLGGGAAGSAWNLFQNYRDRGHASWLAVGFKHGNDPDVLLIPNDLNRNKWARGWITLSNILRRTKIRGVGRLGNILQCIGEPYRWVQRKYGYEDFNFPGTRHLLDLAPKFPDIVHLHNLHGNYFDLRALRWLSQEVPIILNLRDTWLLSGHCAYPLNCERWKSGCGRCPDLSIYPAIPRDATAYNWQCKRSIYEESRLYVTAPSEWLMNQVLGSMLRGVQYRIIPNAIDLRVFRPMSREEARRDLELPPRARIIMLTAQHTFKDYEMMEKALGQLDRSSSTELVFVCLGKRGIERFIGQGSILYPGFERDPKRMALYYCASDIFIHAAKNEVFGKTIVEAMACGLPVVATAVGGIPELIEHGSTGFLVPPGDSDAMSLTIKHLLEDVNLRLSIGEAGAENAKRNFGLDNQANAFLAWYLEILEDWKQKRIRDQVLPRLIL